MMSDERDIVTADEWDAIHCGDSSMTLEYITSLIATGESETLEFKQTTGRRREATRTMCAMLNHRGGHVLFGVTPGGEVTGQPAASAGRFGHFEDAWAGGAHRSWVGCKVEPFVT